MRTGADMDCQKKKIAAAVSAVMTCIKTQEEAAARQAAGLSEADAAPPGMTALPTAVGLWCQSGRQHQMQLRNLMQMRAFHGAKLR
jgi:hypothetical protein